MNPAYTCEYCGGGQEICRNEDHASDCSGGAFCFQKKCVIKISLEQPWENQNAEARFFLQHNQKVYLSARYDQYGKCTFTQEPMMENHPARQFDLYNQERRHDLIKSMANFENKGSEPTIILVQVICEACAIQKQIEVKRVPHLKIPSTHILAQKQPICLKLKHQLMKKSRPHHVFNLKSQRSLSM